MGHSFGGAITQLLLDRTLGAAGVAIHPAPVKGVLRLPLSALHSSFPVLRNPRNRNRAVALTPRQFHYGFANTMSEEESQVVYERYHVPGSGRVLFQAATASLNPRAVTKVDFKSETRAPLLVVGGGKDHTVPPSMAKEATTRQSKAKSATEYREYSDRSYYRLSQEGWEEVADYAIEWATKHATPRPAA